jgi:phosphoribosylanthranilate isomerase
MRLRIRDCAWFCVLVCGAISDRTLLGAEETASDLFAALLNESWEFTLREDPLFATETGDHRYDDRLPQISLADVQRRGAAQRKFLARLEAIDRDELKRVKTLDPSLTVIKSLVVGVRDDKALEAMVSELSPLVDAFITDTFDPKTGASGATGKTHDWRVSRRLVELSHRPIILAGGLTPENVKRAILEVRPAGVDSHTGVEDSSGRKSREKVQKFVAEAREAFELVKQSSGQFS